MIETMKRVFVTGNAGSGKSTLGKELAERMGVDYFSLDGIVWMENWQKTPAQERKQKTIALLRQDAWIIDGVDFDALEAADTVIFLDMPRRVCFYRAAKRNRKYLFTSRPELPENCPEILIIPTLIRIIWQFPRKVKPQILASKPSRQDSSFVHIKNNRQLKSYLDGL